MPAQHQPHCTTCMIPLRRRKDRVFAGTVLAAGSHKCAEAEKVLKQAVTGARMFAENLNFVHIRYISPILTEEAWMHTLQELTVTHDLAHWVIPLSQQGASFVVSHRIDANPDRGEILARLAETLQNAGSRPLPPRILMSWEAGSLKQRMTHVGNVSVA